MLSVWQPCTTRQFWYGALGSEARIHLGLPAWGSVKSIYTMPYRLPLQDEAAYSIAKEISFFLRGLTEKTRAGFRSPPHR